jgi:hypothetical protein
MVHWLWQVIKNEKMELRYDPEILFFGIYPKQLKARSQGDICIPRFIAALFKIVKSGGE